jgi:tRNA (guanine37-N1)-methyltransferase
MTPRGYDYTQKDAERLAKQDTDLIIICGRYEGYDERITTIVDEQICVGHYVLTGGEIPAMVVIDSITRLLPGVLGGETSAEIESFSKGGNREFPQYTRPEDFRGMKVPEVLLSGHHGEIAKWRELNSKHRI